MYFPSLLCSGRLSLACPCYCPCQGKGHTYISLLCHTWWNLQGEGRRGTRKTWSGSKGILGADKMTIKYSSSPCFSTKLYLHGSSEQLTNLADCVAKINKNSVKCNAEIFYTICLMFSFTLMSIDGHLMKRKYVYGYVWPPWNAIAF